MKTVLRAVVTLVALASIALAGASSVHAATPAPSQACEEDQPCWDCATMGNLVCGPVIGGDLEAFRTRVVVTSRSTYLVSVEMIHDDDVTVTPSSFNLDPNESIELAVEGDASGRVGARMSAIDTGPGDTASVTLEVSFPDPPSPEFPWPLVVASTVVVAVALGGLYGVRRVARRYHFLVRKEP